MSGLVIFFGRTVEKKIPDLGRTSDKHFLKLAPLVGRQREERRLQPSASCTALATGQGYRDESEQVRDCWRELPRNRTLRGRENSREFERENNKIKRGNVSDSSENHTALRAPIKKSPSKCRSMNTKVS